MSIIVTLLLLWNICFRNLFIMGFRHTTSIERDMNTCPAYTHTRTQTPCEMLHNSPNFMLSASSTKLALLLSLSLFLWAQCATTTTSIRIVVVVPLVVDAGRQKKGSNRKCVYSVHLSTPTTTKIHEYSIRSCRTLLLLLLLFPFVSWTL